jgi:hypothetical protein
VDAAERLGVEQQQARRDPGQQRSGVVGDATAQQGYAPLLGDRRTGLEGDLVRGQPARQVPSRGG